MIFDIEKYSDENLRNYHNFMVDASLRVETVSVLAVAIWKEVAHEAEMRGLIRFISGSYENIADALVQVL